MIDKNLLTETVEKAIEGSELFIVSIKVTDGNNINVVVDAPAGVDIEQCVKITRAVEEAFDRDVEDYELEVGSAGITAPFTVPQQYGMNVGNDVEILTRDGRKLHARLVDVNADCSEITVAVPTKVKPEGAKRPHIEDVEQKIAVADIKTIVREIKF